MRNLKRALSLALASVMLLGMMVVGTSAASYPDVDENDNVEAIEVLNAVNVMIGRQGNFEPDEAVNRHEMAVIMAKLVLGVDTADNYVGSHPFTDVVPWADKYVAACYENGLVAGTSATTYGGGAPLTAVQAAAMMLRALGYKDLNKDYQGDWRAPITAKANEIRLFSGVASNPNEKLNRNQVAQLALNTLKSPMVTLIDGTFTATDGNGQLVISGGSRQYKVIARSDAYAKAISAVEYQGSGSEGINGYTVELGEHLYNGKLKLDNKDIDDFGRPARTWEYNGKEIGSYVKAELLEKEYVSKVTGKDLYDLLGSSTIKDYSMQVEIDGVEQDADVFRAYIDRNNKAAVGATGTGVLTQVFVDPTYNNGGSRPDGRVWIAIVNTYLAQATKDYDAKKEELTVEVYGVRRNAVTKNFEKDSKVSPIVTNGTGSSTTNVDLDLEDFPIVKDMKKDDFMLVNVAGDEVAIVSSVEALEGVTVSSFQKNSNVTVNGTKYDFASAAHYEAATLGVYTGNNAVENLKDTTYNIYLDAYGNLLGIKGATKTNYVFIAGIDNDGSNIANKTGKARALFLDGTSEVIEFNAEKSKTNDNPAQAFSAGALVNTWCTYTKNSAGVYILTEVGQGVIAGKPGQWHQTSAAPDDITIDKQHITLESGTAPTTYVYGDKSSVYLSAKLANVTNGGPTYGIINGVEGVTVGVEKANLTAWDTAEAAGEYKTVPAAGNYAEGVYTLFNSSGVVIAAVVVGEDDGAAKNLVYVHTKGLEQEYYGKGVARTGEDEWTWTRKVIQNGEEILLTEKGAGPSDLEKMVKGRWYEIKLNADGNVIDVNRTPVSAVGDSDYNLDLANLNTSKTRFVGDYKKIGETVGDSGVSTVLYSERFLSTNTGESVRHSGRTLFVTPNDMSGFIVRADAKVILQQYDRNTQETYLTEYTADQLSSLVSEMRVRGVNLYEYQVNAILESGIASSVIINSNISDWKPDYVPSVDRAVLDLDANGTTWTLTVYTDETKLDINGWFAALADAGCTNINKTKDGWTFTYKDVPYTTTQYVNLKLVPVTSKEVEATVKLDGKVISNKGMTVVGKVYDDGSVVIDSIGPKAAVVATITFEITTAGVVESVVVTPVTGATKEVVKVTIQTGTTVNASAPVTKGTVGTIDNKAAVKTEAVAQATVGTDRKISNVAYTKAELTDKLPLVDAKGNKIGEVTKDGETVKVENLTGGNAIATSGATISDGTDTKSLSKDGDVGTVVKTFTVTITDADKKAIVTPAGLDLTKVPEKTEITVTVTDADYEIKVGSEVKTSPYKFPVTADKAITVSKKSDPGTVSDSVRAESDVNKSITFYKYWEKAADEALTESEIQGALMAAIEKHAGVKPTSVEIQANGTSVKATFDGYADQTYTITAAAGSAAGAGTTTHPKALYKFTIGSTSKYAFPSTTAKVAGLGEKGKSYIYNQKDYVNSSDAAKYVVTVGKDGFAATATQFGTTNYGTSKNLTFVEAVKVTGVAGDFGTSGEKIHTDAAVKNGSYDEVAINNFAANTYVVKGAKLTINIAEVPAGGTTSILVNNGTTPKATEKNTTGAAKKMPIVIDSVTGNDKGELVLAVFSGFEVKVNGRNLTKADGGKYFTAGDATMQMTITSADGYNSKMALIVVPAGSANKKILESTNGGSVINELAVTRPDRDKDEYVFTLGNLSAAAENGVVNLKTAYSFATDQTNLTEIRSMVSGALADKAAVGTNNKTGYIVTSAETSPTFYVEKATETDPMVAFLAKAGTSESIASWAPVAGSPGVYEVTIKGDVTTSDYVKYSVTKPGTGTWSSSGSTWMPAAAVSAAADTTIAFATAGFTDKAVVTVEPSNANKTVVTSTASEHKVNANAISVKIKGEGDISTGAGAALITLKITVTEAGQTVEFTANVIQKGAT